MLGQRHLDRPFPGRPVPLGEERGDLAVPLGRRRRDLGLCQQVGGILAGAGRAHECGTLLDGPPAGEADRRASGGRRRGRRAG